jgi:hypothetical protein
MNFEYYKACKDGIMMINKSWRSSIWKLRPTQLECRRSEKGDPKKMSDNINCLAKSKLNSAEITELKMNVGLRRVPLTDKTGSCLCLKIIQKFKCYFDLEEYWYSFFDDTFDDSDTPCYVYDTW